MELLLYLLKVSVCLTLFFAIYLLFLRRLTFFRTNRLYLLGSLILSLLLPTIQYTVMRVIEPVQNESDEVLFQNEFLIKGASATQLQLKLEPVTVTKHFNWYSLLPYAYGVVTLILLGFMLFKVYQLLQYTRTKSVKVNGLKLVSKTVGFTNCSFFNYVFIDQHGLTENELLVLLQHEKVHAQQYHSLDKMVMMLMKALLWFNPLVYWYDKALEEVHEYEADESTSANFGVNAYASLLLKLAVNKQHSPLIHNFVKSPIKERIKMLLHVKSNTKTKLNYLLALPLALGLFWAFAVQIVYANPKIEKWYTKSTPEIETKRSKDFLVPKVITMKGAFLEINGEISYMYEAKMQLFDGVLSAKRLKSDPKNKRLTAYEGSFTAKNGVLIKGKVITFNLENGTFILDNDKEIAHQDSLKSRKPRLIKSASMQVDANNEISYIKKGEMEIFDMVLLAEDMVYDQRAGRITAKTAELKSKNGQKTIKGESIIFDLNKGTYQVNEPKGEARSDKAAVLDELKDKLQYLAQDSIVNTKAQLILYGNAELKIDDVVLKGKRIAVNKKNNLILVSQGTLLEPSQKIAVVADLIEYNITTKKGVIKNKLLLSSDEYFIKH